MERLTTARPANFPDAVHLRAPFILRGFLAGRFPTSRLGNPLFYLVLKIGADLPDCPPAIPAVQKRTPTNPMELYHCTVSTEMKARVKLDSIPAPVGVDRA